eukprot:scaffold1411_cov396-Prasinococcus_capsulatus_cf.AAC.21
MPGTLVLASPCAIEALLSMDPPRPIIVINRKCARQTIAHARENSNGITAEACLAPDLSLTNPPEPPVATGPQGVGCTSEHLSGVEVHV